MPLPKEVKFQTLETVQFALTSESNSTYIQPLQNQKQTCSPDKGKIKNVLEKLIKPQNGKQIEIYNILKPSDLEEWFEENKISKYDIHPIQVFFFVQFIQIWITFYYF